MNSNSSDNNNGANMMKKFIEYINGAKKIALFAHINPDADALCSCFALRNLLNNNYDNKYIDCFFDGEIADLYSPIIREEVCNPKPFNSYDLAIVLDCPNISRVGEKNEILKKIPHVINIDHHQSNEKFGDVNIVGPIASSTCEIIALIAKKFQWDFNNIAAKELYQGIITDTNCFNSKTITRTTHSVVSDLLKYKFDAEAIKDYYFKNNSASKTKLLTYALRSLKMYKSGQLTTMKIPNDVFARFNATFEDTLGIVDYGLNIDTCKVTAIFIEKNPGEVYISLRSKGGLDVGQIAKDNNGGGSPLVAAYQKKGNIKEIEQSLVEQVSGQLSDNVEEDKDFLF